MRNLLLIILACIISNSSQAQGRLVNHLCTIDQTTGEAEVLFKLEEDFLDLAFTPIIDEKRGLITVLGKPFQHKGTLYTIRISDGKTMHSPDLLHYESFYGLQYNPKDGFIYAMNDIQHYNFVKIDPSTANHQVLDTVGDLEFVSNRMSAIDTVNNRYYMMSTSEYDSVGHYIYSLFTIDILTGKTISTKKIPLSSSPLYDIFYRHQDGKIYGFGFINNSWHLCSMDTATTSVDTIINVDSFFLFPYYVYRSFDQKKGIYSDVFYPNTLTSIDITTKSLKSQVTGGYVSMHGDSSLEFSGHVFNNSDSKLYGIARLDWTSGTKKLIIETKKFKVHPNPTSGQIQFEFDKPYAGEIQLYSSTGELCYKESFLKTNQLQLNLPSALLNGIYLVEIITKEGVFSERLVLQRE